MPSPNAAADSRRASLIASARPSADRTMRMPRPPPPKAAFTSSGNPTSSPAAAIAAAVGSSAIVTPGSTGTPASAISRLASIFDPMSSMARAGGPTKISPASSHARANSARSERNP